MKREIALAAPYVTDAMRAAVAEVLKTRWIGQGPKVEEFEECFARTFGREAVAVGSGTDALHLAYILAGIGPGDEVIAPLFTCTATNIPLLYQGARIVFADVAPGSLNCDVETIWSKVTKRTKAIVVVHYGGAAVSKMEDLAMRCSDEDIVLIEDCAQALGGTYDGAAPIGIFGDFACFSFQAIKHVTTGDGGMLLIRERFLLEKAKRIRWFGIDRQAKFENRWSNDIWELGYKYQMTDIAAAMGIAGLRGLPDQMQKRRMLAKLYAEGLADCGGLRIIDYQPAGGLWLLTVEAERREDLMDALKQAGIESGQMHYRNDRYSVFNEARAGDPNFPNMDAIDQKYVVLPLHMGMEIEDVDRVCSVIWGGWQMENDNLPAAGAGQRPCEEEPYSFIFDKARDSWVCSIHGEVDSAWVPCHAGCLDGQFDEYEDDPINESPGTYSDCAECKGKGGFRVCCECNLRNPDAQF